MPVPSLAKTWQFNVNQAFVALGSALADNRRILRLHIKDALVGMALLPWTVRYSCDSVTAGTAGDAVDRWDSDADLVWANAGSAHSWIVLRQTGVGATFELLISLENSSASGNTLTLVVSPSAAFTGGTTTARPTATDEDVRLSSATWGGVASSDQNAKVHVMVSTDGQCSRVIVCTAGFAQTFWLFDKAQNPVTGWTAPSVAIALGASGSTVLTYANLNTTASAGGRGVSNMTMFLSGEAANSSLIGVLQAFVNDLDSGHNMGPIGLLSATTSNRGRHGSLFDLWWGPQVVADGDTYGTKTFVQFGDVIFPWDGSTPLLA